MSEAILPSWRPSPTRDALLAFLQAAEAVAVSDRVAYFDNDGTLWCERPTYVQYDFFADELRRRTAVDPAVAERPEFAAVLAGDSARIAELGLPRIAIALADLFAGLTPEEFTDRVRDFAGRMSHPVLGHRLADLRYLPMLELIHELRQREFTVGIVTGGGADFLRAISAELYEVAPELVVGTLIEHELGRTAAGAPELRRTTRLIGGANEGPAKVTNIQTQLGRRPLLAAEFAGCDLAVLDPPRVGAVEQVREIAAARVPKVIYAACSPETFARDARHLVDGGLELRELRPIDQFLYAAEVELVALFARPDAAKRP